MTRTLPKATMLLCIVASLNSCSFTSSIAEEKPANTKKSSGNAGCFVQYNDGSVKSYNSLKLVTGLFKAPYLLADGKIKIEASDVCSYDKGGTIAISQQLFESKHNSKVAKEALPGFATCIVRGKLNVYTRKFYNGIKAVDELFVQEGNDGKIVPCSKASMAVILKDNPAALQLLNTKRKKTPAWKQLVEVATLYNGQPLITKN